MKVETIEVINLVFRGLIGILSIFIGYEAWRLVVVVGGIKLSKTFKKIAITFMCYGVARILAGFFDYFILDNHIFLSVIVHDIAFIALWWIIRSRRKELEDLSKANAKSVSSVRDNIEKALVSVENILQRN